MRPYIELGRISFKNNMVFKVDYFTGQINSILSIFVGVAIWKAIYAGRNVQTDINLSYVITYVSFMYLLQSIFSMDDFFFEKKMRSGEIAMDLLRPVNMKLYFFSYFTGTLLFKTVMQLIPTLFIVSFFFHILPPSSVEGAVLSIVSILLGYLVLYNLNFLFWISSFWVYMSWSIITIKDALIIVLSGAVFPIWFMPEFVNKILRYTPFDSIFFIPVSLYLGRLNANEIWESLLKQAIWILILYLLGKVLWNLGIRKIVIQGG